MQKSKIYLYLLMQMTYGAHGTGRCKLGVSNNPQRRVINLRKIGGFNVVKKWEMPNRKTAMKFEKFICVHFPKYRGREFLNVEYDVVQDFIERNIKEFMGG